MVFAFKLACEAVGKLAPAYSIGEESRRAIAADSAFAAAFLAANARVSAMEYRCIEEIDQARQALLELY